MKKEQTVPRYPSSLLSGAPALRGGRPRTLLECLLRRGRTTFRYVQYFICCSRRIVYHGLATFGEGIFLSRS